MRKAMSRSDRGHLVLRKLFLNGAQEGPVCCPVLFKLPTERTHAKSRAEPAPELFVLAQDLQTTLQSGDHDCKSGFLDLFLQPISNVVDNAGPLNINKMLEFIEGQEAYATALHELPQANALADSVAAGHSGSPSW